MTDTNIHAATSSSTTVNAVGGCVCWCRFMVFLLGAYWALWLVAVWLVAVWSVAFGVWVWH